MFLLVRCALLSCSALFEGFLDPFQLLFSPENLNIQIIFQIILKCVKLLTWPTCQQFAPAHVWLQSNFPCSCQVLSTVIKQLLKIISFSCMFNCNYIATLLKTSAAISSALRDGLATLAFDASDMLKIRD